ncbi:MAG: hypothetical protein N3A62_05285, partial [Thermodesulfovibrionales bacterium]|nr:hypothetical protein [Thermodesulfovibrionales bacterium]
ENQTSYRYKEHSANLPFAYSSKNNKLCLTYIIQLVYDKQEDGNLKILGLILISVPNGALKKVYKDEICGGSKNKNEAFRYYYRKNPRFQLLDSKPFRIEVLFLADGMNEEDIIGFKRS